MCRGWLIYNKEDLKINRQFANWLIEYGEKVDLQIELLEKENLTLGIKDEHLVVWDQNGVKEKPQFVINRTRDSLLAYHLEQMGVRVFNPYKVTEFCNHKIKTHQLVMTLGIPAVDSIFFNRNYMKLEMLQLQYPVVIKSPSGHGGKQVYLAQNENEAKHILKQLQDEELLIQRLCNRTGVDVRVFVLGNEIIGAIKRESLTDFRSNFSLGGTASLYHLTNEQEKQVRQILGVLPADYVGIDFMLDQQNNFVFNEIEDAVGSRTLYQYGNIDVAKHYITYIAQQLTTRS